ncbi:MAG: translation initiation factor IF-2 [bacterium]|nr:translation initiation factor IF-2 [bacterium]
MRIKVKSGTTKISFKIVQDVKKRLSAEKAAERQDTYSEGPSKIKTLTLPGLSIKYLAELLEVSLSEVMHAVLRKGLLLNLNSEIDAQTARNIAETLNIDLKIDIEKSAGQSTIKDDLDKIEENEIDSDPDALEERPPVVTIMGHVDHGKTLLLDAIRKTNVVEKEAGGITQHIGAYQIKYHSKLITFLDTPGHAAFTTLRARGAQVTDIAILVVAADDGVKPQTIEAINHAKAAKVPIIVALNKADKPEANFDLCKQQLSNHGLVAEDWGGDIVMVPVSAKTKDGIEEILDMIQLTAEMQELKAHLNGPAKGVVIESRLSRKKGPIATILVKSGTLKVGNPFIAGSIAGKIRALLNDQGQKIEFASPSTPVEILGISEVPSPGNILEVIENEKECKIMSEQRKVSAKNEQLQNRHFTFETISKEIESGSSIILNFIIKADVNGSLEALQTFIEDCSSEKVAINIIHSATGPITENDAMLAKASNALIIGFNVPVNTDAQKMAEEESIEVKTYSIIYEIMDDINKVISGSFKPVYEEYETAKVEVRQIFAFSKVGKIAGSYVLSGNVERNITAKVFRDNKEMFSGKIDSLKRFQEDVKSVASGFECGIVINGFSDLKEGDSIICYGLREKKH